MFGVLVFGGGHSGSNQLSTRSEIAAPLGSFSQTSSRSLCTHRLAAVRGGSPAGMWVLSLFQVT